MSEQVGAAVAGENAENVWLAHFPVPMFAVAMGLAGLGLAWRKAHEVLGVAVSVGEWILIVAGLAYVVITVIYAAKTIRHFSMVRAEYGHPVRSSFFPAFSIATALMSLAVHPYSPNAAESLFWIAAVVHLTFTMLLLKRWLHTDMQIGSANPAWLIPVVGNILIPLPAVRLDYLELGWLFFAGGFLFWIILFAILFYRLVFHPQMPQKLLPTLFILLAPPAVGFLSYQALTGGHTLDVFARLLFYAGLFIGLLIASMLRQFLQVPFGMPFWAYTFPAAAITIATLHYAGLSGAPSITLLSWVFLILVSLIILGVTVLTLRAIARGRLFLPE